MFKIRNYILLLLLFWAIGVKAQIAGNDDIYSLEECIEIALHNNYDIKLSEANMAASGADLTYAFGQYLPSIAVNSRYSRKLNAKPGFGLVNNSLVSIDPKPNSYSLSAGADWLIFDGFGRDNNYSRAKHNLNAVELNTQQTRMYIKLQVYQFFTDVIAKSQIVKARKENLELGKKEFERINAQYEAGLIAIDILYSQQADLGNKEFELVASENDLNISKFNLLVLMGLEPNMNSEFLESSLPHKIENDDINKFRNNVGSLSETNSNIFKNRKDYQTILARLKASEANYDGSYSSYYPRLSLSGGWSWGNTELSNFSELGNSNISLGLSLPIFDQFSTNYRVESAILQLEQMRFEKLKLEQTIINSVNSAMLTLQSSEKQLEISEKALNAASKSYESYQEKFRVGQASITEMLAANTQYVTAQINRINAIYQYFRTQKEVLFSLGLME